MGWTDVLFGVPANPYDWYKSGFDEQRKGYETASQQARDLADKSKKTQLEGLTQAENYYLPAVDMFNAAYGDPSKLRK